MASVTQGQGQQLDRTGVSGRDAESSNGGPRGRGNTSTLSSTALPVLPAPRGRSISYKPGQQVQRTILLPPVSQGEFTAHTSISGSESGLLHGTFLSSKDLDTADRQRNTGQLETDVAECRSTWTSWGVAATDLSCLRVMMMMMPLNAANRIFPRPTPVAMATKFATKLAITRLA